MSRTTRSFPIPSCVAVVAAVVAMAGSAGTAAAQTDVPVGGAVIPINGGGAVVGISVKNKTGKKAKDITVHVFNSDGEEIPDIAEIDVTNTNVDKVDDDGNGKLEGDSEDDTSDSSPGSTCSSIFDGSFDVDNNGSIDVTIVFTGPTPEGTSIRVKFSEEKSGRHQDICMNSTVRPGEALEDTWGGGRRDALATVAHGGLPGDIPIGGFEMQLRGTGNGFETIELPEPFLILEQEVLPDRLLVQFQPPLLPGQCMDLLVGFGQDLGEDTLIGLVPLPAPPPCPGDFNGDGRVNTTDVLDFLNAWVLGC